MFRCSAALVVVSVVVVGALNAQTPVPGTNVNMVSGTTWPGGDPYLQRQNEPSIAVSTRNPQHLLAGANDYRSVDIPFPPDADRVIGDAWLGVFKSFDGGQTWRSTLLPGFPQDLSPDSLASPLHNFQVATDPTVRAGTHGLFYYSGLVFARGNNAPSGVFVARFQDLNHKENSDSIKYLGAALVDTGTSGVFLDKPWLAVDIPRGGAACGNVYLTYSVFTGTDPGKPENNPRSKIVFLRSSNCGASWDRPLKLSETYSLNQGTTLAIDPRNGAVYVAWRQMKSKSQSDGLVVMKSIDGGLTFGKAIQAFAFADGELFDQPSSAGSFRTMALPSLAVDAGGCKPSDLSDPGCVYMVWPQRVGGPTGLSRIMIATWTGGGTTWNTPTVAEPGTFPGHQFMPALTFAAGKLTLAFFDSREDHTKGVLSGGVETRQWMGADTTGQVFNAWVSDSGLKVRHTIDVRLAQASPAAAPVFGGSVRVSQYKFGSRPGATSVEQLQFNAPNLPMFVKGTRPFIGDYIDIAAVPFLSDSQGNWSFNTSANGPPAVHVVWTDNRDVRTPPVNPATGKPDWTLYTPPGAGGGASLYDSAQQRPACVAAQTGSRNQNVYTSRVSPGTLVGVRGNSKPLSSTTQRGFAVFAQNNTKQDRSYALMIANQPPGGSASFQQLAPLVTTIQVNVSPRSSISRMVWVTSSDPHARVTVNVTDLGTGSPQGSILINPDISNPDIANPDIINPDISNPDISNPDIANPDIAAAEVYNPAVANPDISNPDISNPDIANPDISNPDIANPDIANPDISSVVVANPDIINPDIANPDIINPDIANPDIANPDISALPSGGASDLTWKLTNTGNTSASYNAKLFMKQAALCCPAGCPGGANCPSPCYKCQLVLRRTYPTPIASGCTLALETQNVPVANIVNPTFAAASGIANPDISNPDITNATVALAPGEGARVTLRMLGLTLPPASTPPALKPVGVSLGRNSDGSAAASLTITSLELPMGILDGSYSAVVESVGGVGDKIWRLSSGSLPPGLKLDAGVISGTPTAVGTYTFTVQVLDSRGRGDRQALSIQIFRGLRVTSVSAHQSGNPGDTIVKGGQSITVNATVLNDAPISASNVTVAATATAAGTAAATCGPASPLPSLAGNASQVFSVSCGPAAGDGTLTFAARASGGYLLGGTPISVVSGPLAGNSVTVDSTPPAVNFASPVNGATYLLRSSVTASYTCSDPGPYASGVATCTGTSPSGASLDTSTAGARIFTVNASDQAGNTAAASVTYYVIYQFAGFLTPLAAAGTPAAPTFSVASKLGNAIPIKWQLKDAAGAFIANDLTTLKEMWALPISNALCAPAGGAAVLLYSPTAGATGGSVFRYDTGNNQYIFNWDTSSMSTAGCYNLVTTLSDTRSYATIIRLQ